MKFRRACPYVSKADMLLLFSSTPLPGRLIKLLERDVLADIEC